MIFTDFYLTRADGVNLYKTLDVKVNEKGEPMFEKKEILDENGKTIIVRIPIPSGFYIRKVGTNEVYDAAIDVENAPFEYEETDQRIEELDDGEFLEDQI